MSDYSIKESTLTDIGDALRRRHGETKIITVEEFDTKVVSKTVNATGFYTFDGIQIPAGDYYDVVRIPGAVRIEVNVAYNTYKALYGKLHIAAGEYSADNPIPTSPEYVGDSGGVKTLEFEGNTITFHFLWRIDLAGYLGYYAECVGYDADGNILYTDNKIEVEKEIKNTYSSAEMANAIDAIKFTSSFPEEGMVLTGNMDNMFKNAQWEWAILDYGSKISTKNITSGSNMFNGIKKLKKIPFSINFERNSSAGVQTVSSLFANTQLTELPDVSGSVGSMQQMLLGSKYVRAIPESWATGIDFNTVHTQTYYYYCSVRGIFDDCYSLRTVPEAFVKQLWNITTSTSGYGTMFNHCASLDEIVGVRGINNSMTANMFGNMFNVCSRVKRIVFDMDNGAPRIQNWTNQTIDLTNEVGYTASKTYILSYNSGITADKEVRDDATYQALKNDADWFTANVAYSRYNRTSAVETINSLPDCSASGGVNTIKFKGELGSLTDGGAINTLTEAEIAVATAKGWTVSLV